MVNNLEPLVNEIIELCEKEAKEECKKYIEGKLELMVFCGRIRDITKLKEGIRKVAGEIEP